MSTTHPTTFHPKDHLPDDEYQHYKELHNQIHSNLPEDTPEHITETVTHTAIDCITVQRILTNPNTPNHHPLVQRYQTNIMKHLTQLGVYDAVDGS